MDLFNPTIDNYDMGIENVTIEYFKLSNEKIINNDFYKYWELLMLFQLTSQNNILCFNSCSFIQALIYLKNEFFKSKKDDFLLIANDLNSAQKTFVGNYKNIKFTKIENNSALMKSDKIIDKNKYNLACIELQVSWEFDIANEQKVLRDLIPKLAITLNGLTNGGNLIIKLFETFTHSTVKILSMLSTCFDNVYIIKPMTCVNYSSERFVVCSKYTKSPKIISLLEYLSGELMKNNSLGVLNILPSFEFPMDLKKTLISANTHISNEQYISMNKIVAFIDGQNYYGDMYTQERDRQIKASNFWINTFYPNKNDFDKKVKIIENIKTNALTKNTKMVDVK